MKEKIQKIREDIKELSSQISEKWEEINKLESQCEHNWTEPEYIVEKVCFDTDGYGGSYDSERWERTCNNCGKKDTTYQTGLMRVPLWKT